MNIITIFEKFPNQKSCIDYLEKVRWAGKPSCVYCKSNKVSNHQEKDRNITRHQCSACKKSFSVITGTIFEATRLPLQKWFLAINIMMNAKKGISSLQLARELGCTKDTAWLLQMKIRKAMIDDGKLLQGIVEMDETYIGGKPRKEAKKDDDDTTPLKRGRGTKKIPVVGLISRKGKVKLSVESKLKFSRLAELVRRNVDTDSSTLYTDEYKGYSRMKTIIDHKQVDHSKKQYSVNGVSTNSMESFWAIVKRGITGQYHKVSKKYLPKYLNEFAFRYNNRDNEAVFSDVVFNMLFAKG